MHPYTQLLLSLFLLQACSSPSIKKTNTVPTAFRGTLSTHNAVRAQYDLTPLRWSPTLARYAQQWATHQATFKNCNMQHRPHHKSPFKQQYGENLFWASPKRWSDGKTERQFISISEVITSWANEVDDYDYHSNTCKTGEQCGHYTQIVWRETQAVGCAIAVCPDKSQLWVCNYNPSGNYIGEQPY
ncbi:MAG: SCP-like extracellular [Cocleimonas sp.]|nr:SCP-like extracellular [Cocleimonas sp.]